MYLTWLEDVSRNWIFVATSIVLTITIIELLNRKELPPGPKGLPIIGYLLFLGKKPHEKLQELGKKYGDMFSLKLGSYNVVVLNSAKRIKDVLNKPETTGRPDDSILKITEVVSTFLSSGNMWQEHRRFSLRVLRDLGLGKSELHLSILDEIDHFLQTIQSYKGKPCNATELLTPSMSNNICSLIFGKRYEYNDPERKFMDNSLDVQVKFLGQTSITIFFPWIMKLPLSNRFLKLDEFKQTVDQFGDFIKNKIEEHRISLDINHKRDFIDSYLAEMKMKLEKKQSTSLSERYLLGSVFDFFGAGSETVRTSISWGLYTMAAFPEVQKRVQSELDSVVGSSRAPVFSDSKYLPYTMSVLTEVMRWQTPVPLSLLRRTVQDVKVDDYIIPSNTLILSNLWAAHRNPDDWKNPEKFDPERFLSADGKSFVKSENFIAFSFGKRACPGEGLATTEVFLYFTNILKKFTVALPEGVTPCFEGNLGISYFPKQHELCFVSR